MLRAASSVTMPGRFEVTGEDPLTIFDGAHNPSGVAALAAALRDAVGERPLVAVLSVLDDKDAAGMLRELVPLCAGAVFTASRNPRALSPATLASLWSQLSGPAGRDRGRPARGGRARPRARRPRRRRRGHRLDLPRRRPAVRSGAPEGVGAVSPRGPGVLQMVALVAVVVALVILVFFALGYLFGRMFL